MRAIGLALVLAASATSAFAQTESVVEIPSRGQSIRALLLKPANPIASVVLLAGGHGILALAPDGKIGWGSGNQLVRTRADYARAGFATIVPDTAPDMGTPNKPKDGFRWSAEHGRDIGAAVAYMRGVKQPVALVGTSRAGVAAGAALAHASGAGRPDLLVLTAAMLVPVGNQPSFQQAIGGSPAKAQLPFLVVGHKKDACKHTLASLIDTFKRWHGGKVDVVILDGPEGKGDPCDAYSAHGFAGIDGTVVSTVADWIKARK